MSARRGGHARRDPGGLRAHGGRTAAELRPARPSGSSAILVWEGSLIDAGRRHPRRARLPRRRRPDRRRSGFESRQFGASSAVGLAGGAIGAAVLWLLLRRLSSAEVLGTTVQLAAVVGAAAACDAIRDDTGLIAAVVMGHGRWPTCPGSTSPRAGRSWRPWCQLIIGVLFISISATVTPSSLRHSCCPRSSCSPHWSSSSGRSSRSWRRWGPTCRAERGRSSAGWPRAASSPRPPPRRSPPPWSPSTSRARRRSCPRPSWSSSAPSRSTA